MKIRVMQPKAKELAEAERVTQNRPSPGNFRASMVPHTHTHLSLGLPILPTVRQYISVVSAMQFVILGHGSL